VVADVVLIRFEVYCNEREAVGHDGSDVSVETLLFAPSPDGSFEWTTPVDGLRINDERWLPERPEFWDRGVSSDARWRRHFRCPACGDAVTVRDENFRPVVEALLAHEVKRLSLAGLRAGRLLNQ
jgi:hypothetical protein